MEQELEHRLTALEDSSRGHEEKLQELQRRQDDLEELVSSVKVLAVRQETVETDVREIKLDVKRLASKPGQKYDALVDRVCWALMAGIVGFLLTRLGIG